jgi:hypothetical protein
METVLNAHGREQESTASKAVGAPPALIGTGCGGYGCIVWERQEDDDAIDRNRNHYRAWAYPCQHRSNGCCPGCLQRY